MTGRRNFDLNSSTVRRDLYRLASIVMADHVFVEEFQGEDDPLRQLRGQFIEDEIVHLLISTAIMNRIQDEHMQPFRNDSNELSFSSIDRPCGTLQIVNGDDADTNTTLSFREACNKIVHCVHLVAETGGDPEHYPVGNTIILRGTYRDEAWIAHLNIMEYIRASVENFEN